MVRSDWVRLFSRIIRILVITGSLGSTALALAASTRPMPPSGIYAIVPVPSNPAPAPAADLMPDTSLYNQLVRNQARDQILGRLSAVQAQPVEGPGVLTEADAQSSGGTLFKSPTACLTFDEEQKWNGQVHYAAFGNWGTFSVDDGGFYKPQHVRFDMERSVGPGDRSGSEFSFKVAGDQPYAAGLVSPVIEAPPGSLLTVSAKYLLFNHEGVRVGDQIVNDWVSLGLKPDAHGDEAIYINGYARGQWSELVNRVTVGESGQVLVLLQAESPAALNSNIYFDDITIAIDGLSLLDCGG